MNTLQRVAVLWGGGLGDLLVIRPLLQALAAQCGDPPVFMTRTGRLLELLDGFDLNASILRLADSPRQALRQIRAAGKFDLAYLGPHASWKTRMLARGLRADRIWTREGNEGNRFLADVVCEDVVRLGLSDSPPPPYGGVPFLGNVTASQPVTNALVLHVTAKTQWQTTIWFAENWRDLIRRLLASCDFPLIVVGADGDVGQVRTLLAGVEAPEGRIEVKLGMPFPELERLIAGARGVVCHNSGIMHIAAAWKKPTVVITGSSARYWRPPYPWVHNVTSGTCELACNRYRCPVPGYRARCIRKLDVDTVWQAVAPLLK